MSTFRREIKALPCFLPGLMFNTGIGQHILKNPLIVNSIIDKVGVEEENESCGLIDFVLRSTKAHRGCLSQNNCSVNTCGMNRRTV